MADYEKRGYLLENFRLFHLRSEQNSPVDFHYHEFCKLLLLVSGRGAYTVDGQRYLLQSGDVVLVGSRSVHRPEMELGVPYERIIIYIAPEFLQKQSTEDCDLLECFAGNGGHVLRLKESRRKGLFALAEAVEKAMSGEPYGREILSTGALLQLLVQLLRHQRLPQEQTPQPVAPQNDRVREWMRYIDSHLAEDLDMDALAERFFVSKYHMMRSFRSQTGFTIHTYLLQRRLLAARQLIEGGMRATEACYRCGFGSYSAFTRAYGKHLGTTPTGRMAALHERDEILE